MNTNIEIRFNTYAHNNMLSFACETRDRYYEVDVYANGHVQCRINLQRVTHDEMNRSAYGRAVLAHAEKMKDACVAMMQHTQVSNAYRIAWWDIRNATQYGVALT